MAGAGGNHREDVGELLDADVLRGIVDGAVNRVLNEGTAAPPPATSGNDQVAAEEAAACASPSDGVIATGGGAFVNAETRALILDRAVTVWIDCDLATLVERTGRRDHRPLLRDGDPEEILGRLLRERAPLYAQAHIRVEGQKGPHNRTAMAIIEGIEQWLS